MTEQENNSKPTFTLVIITITWIIALLGFLGLLVLSFMALFALQDSEVMLVWIATPIQFLALKKAIPTFENKQKIRSDGAGFALAMLILIGATLLNLAILIAIIFIGCS